jgi:hypothetical protein
MPLEISMIILKSRGQTDGIVFVKVKPGCKRSDGQIAILGVAVTDFCLECVQLLPRSGKEK